MYLRWKRRTHATDIQRGPLLCQHLPHPVVTLTPVLLRSHRESKGPRQTTIWRPGVGIRECCLRDWRVRAAWWTEVSLRLNALVAGDELPEPLAAEVLCEVNWLLAELGAVVPPPTDRQLAEFERMYGDLPPRAKRRKVRPPAPPPEDPFTVFGLTWPCTEGELRARWRRIAFAHHPDRGGDHGAFVRFSEARAACEERIRTTS